MGRTMLSKSVTQFSVDGQGCVPLLLLHLRPNYGGGNEDNGGLLQKVPCLHCCTQCPDPAAGHHRPTLLPELPGHSQASLGHSLVGSLLLSPGCWCAQGFVCALQESVSPVLWKFYRTLITIKSHWPPKSNSLGVLSLFAGSPGWEICCRS